MDGYEEAAKLLASTQKTVGFTGAGSSAESGIPTFRDPGGIWDQFDPEEFGTVEGIMDVISRKPDLIRKFLLDTVNTFSDSKPNHGHQALAELESMGLANAVITQNIDNLHTDAGSKTVWEVHGNLFRARCVSCPKRYPLDKDAFLSRAQKLLQNREGFDLGRVIELMPKCECGGITRPDVVMFGEAVQNLREAYQAAETCEVMLVLGTSGVVYPAAALPGHAHQNGAKIIGVNPHENSFEAITEVYINEPAGEAMPKVMEHVRRLLA